MEKAEAIVTSQNRFIYGRWVQPRITTSLINEHRRDPFGKHSSDLDIVLNFFRRRPDKSKPLYVLVRERAGQYRIGEAPMTRGQPVRIVVEEVYRSEEEAEHAVFLRQVRDFAAWPSEVSVPGSSKG